MTDKIANQSTKNENFFERIRNSQLKIVSEKPFNAETPTELSVNTFLTSNELFFVRCHLPLPEIDLNNYFIEIINKIDKQIVSFKLDDIKKRFNVFTLPGICFNHLILFKVYNLFKN